MTAVPADSSQTSVPTPTVRDHAARVRRFADRYAWLVRDALGRQKLRTVVVTAVSTLGAFAQVGAIGVLHTFVRAMRSPDGGTILGFPIHNDLPSLLALVVSLIALQFLSALAVYFAVVQGRAMARRYHLHSASRMVARFSATPVVALDAFPDATATVRKAMANNPRILGKAVETILACVQVSCYVIGYLVFLLILNVKFSLLTLPILLVVLPFLYRLGTHTQRTAKTFYDHAIKDMVGVVRRSFTMANRTNVHADLYAEALREQYVQHEAVRQYYDSYDHLLLAAARATLITSLFRPLLLAAMLFLVGYLVLKHGYSWSDGLIYLLALWQLLNNLQHLAAHLTSLNRFYPRVATYRDILATLASDRATAPASGAAAQWPLVLEAADGDATVRLPITPGRCVVCAGPCHLSRVDLRRVLGPLERASAAKNASAAMWRTARFVGRIDDGPNLPLIQYVYGAGPAAEEHATGLTRTLTPLGLAEELETLPDGAATVLTDAVWWGASDRLRAALGVAALRASNAAVVLLDWRVLRGIDSAFADTLLRTLDKQAVFLVTPDATIECPWAHGFVLIEDDRVTGAGPAAWWESIRTRREHLAAERSTDASAEDEEDEDAEDI